MSIDKKTLDFLIGSGLCEKPAEILPHPLVTEERAPQGHALSIQPEAVIRSSSKTLLVFLTADLSAVAEELRTLDQMVLGPYRTNVPIEKAEVILVFDSAERQAAFGQMSAQRGAAYGFPLFFTWDEKISQYPKTKSFWQLFKDRLFLLCRRAFEY